LELSAGLEARPTGSRPRFDHRLGALVGTTCDACGAVCWPSRAFCQRCGSPGMRETPFAATGRLLTYTTVWVPRPGLDVPYTLGQVELDGGPLVFGHLRGLGDHGPQSQVRLLLDPDPGRVPPFWFEVDGS
jgi:uncharacterized protein